MDQSVRFAGAFQNETAGPDLGLGHLEAAALGVETNNDLVRYFHAVSAE
jgi:hypothetical protein